jgi:arsenate reductase
MNENTAHIKKRILFVCSGNACRSQIAEGWARALAGDTVEVFSAGIEANGIDPAAVAVMAEVGVDISDQRSKSLGVLPSLTFDIVVTLSGRAADRIGELPVPWRVVNLPCESPVPRAIGAAPSLAFYRKTRDHIRSDVEGLLRQTLCGFKQPRVPVRKFFKIPLARQGRKQYTSLNQSNY